MKQFLRYLFFSFSFTIFAFAQDYRYNITPYIGYNFTDKEYWLGDSFAGGINFDTFLTNNVGIRTGYERVFSMQVKDDPRYSYHMDRFYLNLLVRNNTISNVVTPYVAFGGGYENGNGNIYLTPDKWFYNLTVGSSICINDRLSLSPELKMMGRKRSHNHVVDYLGTVGLTYKFGAPNIQVRERIVQQRVEVPVERIVKQRVEVPVMMCQIPKITKDYCDNSYYIQVASAPVCSSCPLGYKNRKFLHKIKSHGYDYSLFKTRIASGQYYTKVLIGPYRCKKTAYKHLCKIKKDLGCDAFVYRKKGHHTSAHKSYHKHHSTHSIPAGINPSWLK